MKFITVILSVITFFADRNSALDAENYTAFIKELGQNEKFFEDYTKWSFELFSQPNYLYGDGYKKFPCPITKNPNIPTSVHGLRPSDIQCIGAIGDSLTAGLGAHAMTPVGLLLENRG